MLTTEVENYPGFPDGVLGPELMASMRAQATRFGAELHTAKVSRVDLSGPPFKVWVGPDFGDPAYEVEALIVATGAQSLLLGVPGEERLFAHGVSTCATCDGFFFRGQDIAVVGGGDSALEEALFLTRFANTVTLVHRRDQLRASKIMQDRAFAHPSIKVRWNSRVLEVQGESKVERLRVVDTVSGEEADLPVSGLFVAIGHEPNTALVKGQLELDDMGYVKTFGGSITSVEGVFVCGDLQDHYYRQAITAAGSGCMAAIDAERYLEARGS
jgi:thioredoxin reductase (NADPH)